MNNYQKISLVIASLALLIGIATYIHNMQRPKNEIAIQKLQELQEIVTSDTGKFNGILNAAVLSQELSEQNFNELFKIYANVRDAYKGRHQYIGKSARNKIDKKIDDLETNYIKKQKISYEGIEAMSSIMELIKISSQ